MFTELHPAQYAIAIAPYLGIAVLIVVVGLLLLLTMVHLGFRAPRVRESGDPGKLDLDFETVSIPGVVDRRLPRLLQFLQDCGIPSL